MDLKNIIKNSKDVFQKLSNGLELNEGERNKVVNFYLEVVYQQGKHNQGGEEKIDNTPYNDNGEQVYREFNSKKDAVEFIKEMALEYSSFEDFVDSDEDTKKIIVYYNKSYGIVNDIVIYHNGKLIKED